MHTLGPIDIFTFVMILLISYKPHIHPFSLSSYTKSKFSLCKSLPLHRKTGKQKNNIGDTMLLRGTFPTCNVTVRDYKNKHRFLNFNSQLIRTQKYGYVSSSVAPIMAVATKNEQASFEPSLADKLRLGSLTEDGMSYKEKFIVRCYEVGMNKTATVETIANLLQEVACNHVQSCGFSTDGFATTTTMRKLHLIWVTARMHIEMYKYPAWSDVVEIETWCQNDGRIGTRRDWILKDYATGEVIGRATSKWVMMNQDTRRLQKVTNDVHEEYLVFFPKELRLAFPEENNGSLKKIAKLEDPAQYSRLGLVPRRSDFDMNKHVNNVTYIGWIFESMPQDIIDTHELQTITLDFRRECQHDDVVDSLTSVEPFEEAALGTNGSATASIERNKSFLHLVRLSGGLEINRSRTEWRKKPVNR